MDGALGAQPREQLVRRAVGPLLALGDEELVEKARQVLRRAVRSQDNEWWTLWDEAGLADDVTASCRRALAWLGDRDD